MTFNFSTKRRAGWGVVGIAAAIAGGVALLQAGGESGASEAVTDLEEQFEELSWWDKVLLGVGYYDVEDVMEVPGNSAVSGVPIGRS